MRKGIVLFSLAAALTWFASWTAWAQEADTGSTEAAAGDITGDGGTAEAEDPAGAEDTAEPAADVQAPTGFRGIDLGMDLETVKEKLLEDPFFDYRGEPDVSFLPQTRESLIECAGLSYISRAYFQFSEKQLYIMILVLDEKRIDHYSLFTTLTEKYGPFSTLSPAKVVWETEDTLFSLERPLTVKYMDRLVFESLKAEGMAEEDLRTVSRSRFLEEF